MAIWKQQASHFTTLYLTLKEVERSRIDIKLQIRFTAELIKIHLKLIFLLFYVILFRCGKQYQPFVISPLIWCLTFKYLVECRSRY